MSRSITELQTDIAALEAALRELALGNKVAKLSYEGNSVEYTAADAPSIRAILAADRAELARVTNARRGPMRVVY